MVLSIFKKYKSIICVFAFCFTSCTLTRPLPLKPFNNTSVQKPETFELSKFNGDYEIISTDTSSHTLEHIFTYSSKFHSRNLPGKNDFMRLSVIDGKHIKASLLVNNEVVKTKIIKGRIINNYFESHTSHFKFRFIINIYEQQSSRLTLSNVRELYVDINRGGGAFLIFMPIPLSFASDNGYNLKFKRR
jgi:hypothetical protein